MKKVFPHQQMRWFYSHKMRKKGTEKNAEVWKMKNQLQKEGKECKKSYL